MCFALAQVFLFMVTRTIFAYLHYAHISLATALHLPTDAKLFGLALLETIVIMLLIIPLWFLSVPFVLIGGCVFLEITGHYPICFI